MLRFCWRGAPIPIPYPPSQFNPSTSINASATSFQRVLGKVVIHGPSEVRSTVFIHSGFNTHSPGSPSSLDRRISQGKSLICVDKGITGICAKEGRTSSRPRTSTGLRLSGASKRNQRMSPRVITECRYQARLRLARSVLTRPTRSTIRAGVGLRLPEVP